MDLINGRVEAVVIDSNPAAEYVKSNEGKIVNRKRNGTGRICDSRKKRQYQAA